MAFDGASLVKNRMYFYGIPHFLFAIIYSVVICRHLDSASFNHRTSSPLTYKTKFMLNVICAAICLFFTIVEMDTLGWISLIQLIFVAAWLCSAHLLKFSYDRALPISWPHRLYWVLSLIVTSVVFTFEMLFRNDESNIGDDTYDLINSTYFIVMISIYLGCHFILCVMAFRCPKDFFYTPNAPLLPSRYESGESELIVDDRD